MADLVCRIKTAWGKIVTGKIAYVMSRFPHLPETFILREMNALENLGWDIALYPLISQHQEVIHDEARTWIRRARNLPFISIAAVKTNFKTFFHNPRLYVALLFQVVLENLLNLKFLLRALILFPKAVHMASEMTVEGVEHIHAHYATHPALAAWIIHRLTNLSYSVTVHAHDIFVRQTMLKTKLGEAAFVVPISQFNQQFLEETVGLESRDAMPVIHCGIEPAWYSRNEQDAIRNEIFEIINVGSLQSYKGHMYLLEACLLLKQLGVPFRCRIIGEGKQRINLEDYISKHDLKQQVQLVGALSQADVAEILPSADCYVQPSVIDASGKMEGIPVSLMEAFASGLPVVATDISGISELVQQDKTGFLVPEKDSLALASALQAVHEDLSHARRLANAGFELVSAKFSLSKNVLLLSEELEQLVGA
jgi:colanic acid/amylovoran biosynthesis glycosyltransferase